MLFILATLLLGAAGAFCGWLLSVIRSSSLHANKLRNFLLTLVGGALIALILLLTLPTLSTRYYFVYLLAGLFLSLILQWAR